MDASSAIIGVVALGDTPSLVQKVMAAHISGYALEDEKVLGTTHVALGNNKSFGGTNDVPIHLDAVVYKSTIEIDGKIILSKGKLAIE